MMVNDIKIVYRAGRIVRTLYFLGVWKSDYLAPLGITLSDVIEKTWRPREWRHRNYGPGRVIEFPVRNI